MAVNDTNWLSLTDWLSDSLTDSCLVDLMMRIVSATVCCNFGNWGMVKKLNFCSDFEHKVWSRLWSWCSGMICMLKRFSLEKSWLRCRHWLPLSLTDSLTPSLISLQFVCDKMLMFGWNFEISVVEIMKQKFDQDLCLNLWYDPLSYFDKLNSTFGTVVPLATFVMSSWLFLHWMPYNQFHWSLRSRHDLGVHKFQFHALYLGLCTSIDCCLHVEITYSGFAKEETW